VTTLEAALAYADRGVSVIPVIPLHTPTAHGCSCPRAGACVSAGKHPRLDWKPYQLRRAGVEEIREWWTRWPAVNVGIVTGTISGVCVLDVDPRNGGFATLAELDHRGAAMPTDNPLVETGSLGLHHYFVLEAPLAKAAPFDGIELQADGAMVVAPPSLHRAGRRYQWLGDLQARRVAVPAWLRWAVEQVSAPPAVTARPLRDAHEDDVLGALHHGGLWS
jgi:putative DNA primase/helicase